MIEHGQVVVRVRRRMRLEIDAPIAEIQENDAVDGQVGQHEGGAGECPLTQVAAGALEIRPGTSLEPSGELVVPDEARMLGEESRVAEHMVRMHVRIDDVTDG